MAMAERLVSCEACLRHVRSSEVACPFCGAVVSPGPQPTIEPFRRLAVAAAVAAGVAALTGCGSGAGSSVGFGGSLIPPYGGGPIPGNGMTCRTSAGCLPGQVCCGTANMTSSCQAGPCPSTMFGPLQLCGISAECLATADTCGPSTADPELGVTVMTCNAPSGDDGGSSSSSSSGGDDGGNAEGGSSRDADNDGDDGISDAPTGS
jgi:hypothetical protein